MNELGTKIKGIRKAKGLSQESLADLAKINLRTVQRIENNENQPHGKTLQLICEALEVNPEDIIEYGKKEGHGFLVWFHLSVLSCLVIPLGNIILPLILWLSKKKEITGLKTIGANLLNFQILWTVVSYLTIMGFALGKIMHYKNMYFVFYLWLIVCAFNFVLAIYSAIRAKKGNIKPFYPHLIPFIK